MNEKALFEREGKNAVNNFVWVHAPGNMTLEEADALAHDIYTRILEEWSKREPARSA